MKIVGTAGNGFLLKATPDELARLAGFASMWYYERETGRKMREGDEISIDALYRHHSHIREVRASIANSKKALEGVIAGLELSDSILIPVTEEQKPESEEQK